MKILTKAMQSVVIEELSIHKSRLEDEYKAAGVGKTKIANRVRKINQVIKRLRCLGEQRTSTMPRKQ